MIEKTIRRFGFVITFALAGLLLTSAATTKAVARRHRTGRYGTHARLHVHGRIRHNASRAYAARYRHGKHFARLSCYHHLVPQRALTSEEKSAIVEKIRELAESSPGTDVLTPATPIKSTASADDSIVAAEKNSPDVQAQIEEAAKEEQAEDGVDASLDRYFKERPGATTPSVNPSAMAAALDPAMAAEQQPDITLSDETDPDHSAQRSDVMAEIINWIGTRYLFGGVDRNGIDCSAFTREVFEKSFGLELPRTAYDQYQLGQPVDKTNLEFGDLVFFRTAGYAPITHVGIYIGEGLFANAACSRGVTVASLESEYWQKHYVGARRLFTNSGMAQVKTDQTQGAMADGDY